MSHSFTVHVRNLDDIKVSAMRHDTFDSIEIQLGEVKVSLLFPERICESGEGVQDFRHKVLDLPIEDYRSKGEVSDAD
tara:strand:+ start:199 stop:432 length:234 start_codon:yes stop_codon:yes gene_type:complete